MNQDRLRRLAPIAAAVGGVLVVALVVGVVFGTGILGRPSAGDPGADPSDSPVATPSPEPSESGAPQPSDEPSGLAYEPPPGVLPPSAVVVVNQALELHEGADDGSPVVVEVEAGRRMTVYGPLMVDGRRWYTLASTDQNDPAYGYVELDPAGDQVALEPVECPAGEPTIATIALLSRWERLACHGDREIVLSGHEIVGFGGYTPGVFTPAWLNGIFGAFAIADPADPERHTFVYVPPDGPDTTRPQPSSTLGTAQLRVTGHFNDEASTSCSSTELPIDPANSTATAALEPIAAELSCRGNFVVTAFEVVDEGSGEEPSLAELEVGSVVAPVLEGVTLREDPGTDGRRIGALAPGSQNIVIEGPVEADGFAWYRLAAIGLPPYSGCITGPVAEDPLSCPIWYGWAAAGNPEDGSAWFVATDVDCPDPDAETIEFMSLPFRLPLVCYGTDEISFTAFYPEQEDEGVPAGACAADPSVAWLYCVNLIYEEFWATETYGGGFNRFFIDPVSGVELPERGRWLRVTGRYDHPAASSCDEAEEEVGLYGDGDLAVLYCRTHFVVSAVEVTSAP